MNHDDQGINADDSVDVHLKRKRGRPRKVPKLNYDENILITNNKGKQHMEGMPISPDSGVNGRQTHPAIKIQKVADGMLGQVVSGVIEAAFEAGYLLCVKVGDSGLTLRGVVFKPGCYVPVSAENDLAPDAQMIRRNTVPFATENETNGNHPPSKNEEVPSHESSDAKLGFKYTPPHSSLDASKDQSISSVFAHVSASGSSRGTVVPVVLQPAILTSGPGPSVAATESLTIQMVDIQSSKGEEVLVDTLAANESVTVGIESSFPFPTQSSQKVLHYGVVSVENSSHNQSFVLEVHDSEDKSMTLPSTPFDSLVSEGIKRIQAPPLLAKTENDNPTGKTSAKECEDTTEVEDNTVDGPFMVESLKEVQPIDTSSVPVPKAQDDDESGTGKMTELLQENMMQTTEPCGEMQIPGLILKLDEHEESKAEIGDEEETANQKQI